MQIRSIGHEIIGFRQVAQYAIRCVYMVKDEAKKRAKILLFWKRYGLKATKDAFGVSRATLFEWKKRLKEGKGRLSSLNTLDKAPRKRRIRLWPIEIIRMIKIIRAEHPNLGKEKIHPELKEFCHKQGIPCPSIATIGRLIADDPSKMRKFAFRPSCAGRRIQRNNRQIKARKPKGYVPKKAGECLALDTIEKIIHGSRRYVVTATDVHSRFSFAYATKSHGSKEAAHVFKAIFENFPYTIEHVLTDNGSEFIDWNLHLLQDPTIFNKKLADWIVWYNTKRPHKSLNLQSPVQFLIQQNPEESRMRWAHTSP